VQFAKHIQQTMHMPQTESGMQMMMHVNCNWANVDLTVSYECKLGCKTSTRSFDAYYSSLLSLSVNSGTSTSWTSATTLDLETGTSLTVTSSLTGRTATPTERCRHYQPSTDWSHACYTCISFWWWRWSSL